MEGSGVNLSSLRLMGEGGGRGGFGPEVDKSCVLW